jgi:hypothetical protein
VWAGESIAPACDASGTRESGVCFASKQNDEERAANFLSDEEKRFVAEFPRQTLNRKGGKMEA